MTERTADDVGVAAEVLRRGVHDDVGAEGERVLQVRRGERVVDDRASAPVGGETATAAMSTIASSGFDGVSIHTSFVFGRRRRQSVEDVRSAGV